MMTAMSKLYIELQVESALLEVFDTVLLPGASPGMPEMDTVARHLIEALDDREIELRPR